jgi:hypothetical protein
MQQPDPAEARTVSGRRYSRTRPRGFAPWKPRADAAMLIEMVLDVIAEHAQYGPMTKRQIFYRLVGKHGYPKTEKSYDRLLEHLARAQRARLVPMSAIRDDGPVAIYNAGGYDSAAQWWESLRSQAEHYQHDPGDGQPVLVELWVESAGMTAMVGNIAQEYGVNVFSSGGFESLTAKYQAAQRIAYEERPTSILSIGDRDPSGLSMLDAAAEDVAAFVAELGGQPPAFARLAVTEAQIRRYQLETVPQKEQDKRGEHMDATVQAEALAPEELAQVVRTGLEKALDKRALTRARRRTERERAEILQALDRLGIGEL